MARCCWWPDKHWIVSASRWRLASNHRQLACNHRPGTCMLLNRKQKNHCGRRFLLLFFFCSDLPVPPKRSVRRTGSVWQIKYNIYYPGGWCIGQLRVQGVRAMPCPRATPTTHGKELEAGAEPWERGGQTKGVDICCTPKMQKVQSTPSTTMAKHSNQSVGNKTESPPSVQ